jgi:predicted nucleotidyltransferase
MSPHTVPAPRPPQATALAALPRIVERVVATVHPCRIILFGSGARGTMTHDSDLDLLVILPDGISRRAKTQSLYRVLADMPYATDVVVATVSD